MSKFSEIKSQLDAILKECPAIQVFTKMQDHDRLEWEIVIPELPACRYHAYSPGALITYMKDAQAAWERHTKNKETLERVNRKARGVTVKKVIIFNGWHRHHTASACSAAQEQANTWLIEHPEALIIASHTNMTASENFTEFVLTLIVEMPEEEEKPEEHGLDDDMEKAVLDAIVRNDPAFVSDIERYTGFTEHDIFASIAKLLKKGKIARFLEGLFRPACGEEHA